MNKNTYFIFGFNNFWFSSTIYISCLQSSDVSFLCILIVLAMTWNVQGGQMGYNTFGNILFLWSWNVCCCKYTVGNVLFIS